MTKKIFCLECYNIQYHVRIESNKQFVLREPGGTCIQALDMSGHYHLSLIKQLSSIYQQSYCPNGSFMIIRESIDITMVLAL